MYMYKPYTGLFSRGVHVYFANFEIAMIHEINSREINRKPHPPTPHVYTGLFSRGVYFANFEIAVIHEMNSREINRKPHPPTSCGFQNCCDS